MAVMEFYEFGSYRLEVGARRLLRRGEPVALAPKAFDALTVLVERRNRVVSKSELMQALWPDTFVEEANLSQTIFLLRRALGETAEGRQYIETFPKRGYRFVAEAREGAGHDRSSAAAPPAERARWWILAPVVMAVAGLAAGLSIHWLRSRRAEVPARDGISVRTIAVLPFQTLTSAGADDEHLGLGMADAVITRLGNVRRIVVRPTSAVREYQEGTRDPAKVGRDLRVDAVLDGSIQKAGERIRVTVRLVEVGQGAPLWSDTFDERFTDIFAVQDSISEQVATALAPNLTGGERTRLTRSHTTNTEAYRFYVRGRYDWNGRSVEGLKRSIESFEKAIETDPTYALAYSALADSYNVLGIWSVVPAKEAFPRAKAAARRAVELDGQLVEAQVALAFVQHRFDWDWEGAERGFRRAIRLAPNYGSAHLWYGNLLSSAGRLDEALVESNRAAELEPLSLISHGLVAHTLYLAGQHDRALEQCRQALEMDESFYATHVYMGRIYQQKKAHDQAIRHFKRARELARSNASVLAELGHVYAVAGRRDEARGVLLALQGLPPGIHVPGFWVALIHAGLGEADRALDWLERAYEERHPWLVYLKVEPRLEPLRSHPRFADLVRHIGIPAAR